MANLTSESVERGDGVPLRCLFSQSLKEFGPDLTFFKRLKRLIGFSGGRQYFPVGLLTSTTLFFAIAASSGAQSLTVTAPVPTYSIVSRGPNERVWQRSTVEVSPSGETNTHALTYIELASGLCFQPPGQTNWIDSSENISVLDDGTASATDGWTRARWPADLFSGPIQLQNGATVLSEQPQSLVYSDGTNYVYFCRFAAW
jgi:hypothetical protein